MRFGSVHVAVALLHSLEFCLPLQGALDEAASFCFNVLDSGRKGLVSQQDFITAATGCAAVALHDQAGSDQSWAHALAAGKSFCL